VLVYFFVGIYTTSKPIWITALITGGGRRLIKRRSPINYAAVEVNPQDLGSFIVIDDTNDELKTIDEENLIKLWRNRDNGL
jgi:hypothetical protein